jgi:hypothetical protein
VLDFTSQVSDYGRKGGTQKIIKRKQRKKFNKKVSEYSYDSKNNYNTVREKTTIKKVKFL